MTGMGEDVYIDHKANREAVLDELVAESQRLGLYGDAPYNAVEAMVEAAARAACRGKHDRCHRDGHSCAIGDACVWWMGSADNYRAALESLGVPMETLAALQAGDLVAVPPIRLTAKGAVALAAALEAAPKTPEEGR